MAELRGVIRHFVCCVLVRETDGTIIRMIYVLLGPKLTLDLLLLAYDIEALAETPQERRSLLMLVCLLSAVGAPIKWSKFRGGFATDWIGLHTCYRSFALGLSLVRSQWLKGGSKRSAQKAL